MPRPHRFLPGGFVYHVINRANDKARIFRSERDFESFLGLMRRALAEVPVPVCAFSVMPTHWHLVLWPRYDGAVSALVHRLCTLHAVQHRRSARSVGHGHVYQGRFRSFPVEGSRHYYAVVKYVEANALRARLVDRAEAWRWSSLYDRTHESSIVTAGPLELPGDWLEVVNSPFRLDVLEALRGCARTSRPYGSERWVTETAANLGITQTLRPRGRPRLIPSERATRAPVRSTDPDRSPGPDQDITQK